MILVHRKVTNRSDMFNIEGILIPSEPLWRHTTFSVGGPADLYAVPVSEADLTTLLKTAEEYRIPVFILGGGSNILVSDTGFRGLVIDMRLFSEYRVTEDSGGSNPVLILGAGGPVSDAAWNSGNAGLAGLDYFFGMPGSVGGALWMNARCYDGEIADSFLWADVMDREGRIRRVLREDGGWSYKISPFQNSADVIIRAAFKLEYGHEAELKSRMLERRNDRRAKGHFRAPCAGSAFKNNRAFGEPSGALIDRCGLKGYRIGGASVSDWHGNIFVNDAGAAAADIRRLLDDVAEKVEKQTGFRMEAELRLIGEWDQPE